MYPASGSRNRRRSAETLPVSYRRYADLSRDARLLAESLPADVDRVVGLRGSGTFVASLLSLHLGVPMVTLADLRARGVVGDDPTTADADAGTEGGTLAAGRSGEGHIEDRPTNDFDDSRSVLRGGRVVVVATTDRDAELATAREAFEAAARPSNVAYASVYVANSDTDRVDHWGTVVERPCLFEWTLLHHPMLEECCFDIDGVLCRDPTPEENDDGERYEAFLETVEPLALPTRRIGWLVTSRLEQYREETEAWLDRHGVRYDELVMMDHESAEERRAAGNHGGYKAAVYASADAPLFVESDPNQAAEIARWGGKPVLSYGTNELLAPGDTAGGRPPRAGYLDRFTRHPVPFARLAARHVAGRCSRTLRRAVGRR